MNVFGIVFSIAIGLLAVLFGIVLPQRKQALPEDIQGNPGEPDVKTRGPWCIR